MRVWKLMSAVAVATSLVACGGGGGGGGGTTPKVASTETFQLATAWANFVQTSGSKIGSVSGSTTSGSKITGTFTVTDGNVSSSTFEGQSALAKSLTATGNLVVGGTSVPSSTTITNYFDTNYKPLGQVSSDEYDVVNGDVNIPTTVKVNDTGVLYTFTRYDNSNKTVSATNAGVTTVSYVIEADTASTALFKMIEIEDHPYASYKNSTSTNTFRITPTGGVTRIEETYTDNDMAVTVTY